MLSTACPKVKPGQLSRLQAKLAKRLQADADLRACYRAVDARDDGRCRVTGKRGNPYASTLIGKLHRHHLIPRSRGGPDASWNVVSITSEAHDQIHVLGTLRLSGDADARDEMGALRGVQVERLTETGWVTKKFC